MCEICQDAKNKWFHRIVKKWEDVSIEDVKEVCEKAFGEGSFEYMYPHGKVNWQGRVTCRHCGENYHVRTV